MLVVFDQGSIHHAGQIEGVGQISQLILLNVGVDVGSVHLEDIGHGVGCSQHRHLLPVAFPSAVLGDNVDVVLLAVELSRLFCGLVTDVRAPPGELHGNFAVRNGGLRLSGLFGSGSLLGCGRIRRRRSFGSSGSAAAGCQRQHHSQRQQDCEDLLDLHCSSSLRILLQFFELPQS